MAFSALGPICLYAKIQVRNIFSFTIIYSIESIKILRCFLLNLDQVTDHTSIQFPFKSIICIYLFLIGWSHICDHSCLEGIIDSEGAITCPITGRTSQQLVSRQEERAMRRSTADASFRAADLELNSFSLARAYTQGT